MLELRKYIYTEGTKKKRIFCPGERYLHFQGQRLEIFHLCAVCWDRCDMNVKQRAKGKKKEKELEYPPLEYPFISKAYSGAGENAGVPVASDSSPNMWQGLI